ncbi:MAG: hypothetical protein SFV51_19795 [Bryobacteraceae bacterium]|nr:hypothetical protein [Bryobacteraceae bacterium]
MTEQENAAGSAPRGGCACGGAGPVMSEFFKRMGPDESVKQHFRTARIEFLKGLRAIIDQRISDLSQSQQQKGSKVNID